MNDSDAPNIEYTQFIDEHGTAVQSLPEFAHSKENLIKVYRGMLLTRAFDAKAVALQRTGRLGTFASSLGQEAVAIGIGAAMNPSDVLVPSFREQGAMLMRGVSPLEMFLYWGGDERGSNFAVPREDFPVSVPIGTHAPHAAGVALAIKLRKQDRAVLCAFGDGATSKGDVYEAMNFAGVWDLPLVFVVNNNQWAISMPASAQTACETLAQKAVAAGFAGEQVDGNDVIAVRQTCAKALSLARTQSRPHMIEALTYRLSDHTTADDASRYRGDDVVSPHWKKDPVTRIKRFLVTEHGWGKNEEESLLQSCKKQVDAAADEYLATPVQAPESMFDYLYETLPEALQTQRQDLIRRSVRNG